MAHHQLNQPKQARARFDQATLAEDADGAERLIFNRLREEAAQLLNIDPKPKR